MENRTIGRVRIVSPREARLLGRQCVRSATKAAGFDRPLSLFLSPQPSHRPFFSVHTPLFIPNDSPWVSNANLVRKVSAGLILLSVCWTLVPTFRLALTPHLRIGAIMNMVINSYVVQVPCADWSVRLLVVEYTVCEFEGWLSSLPCLLKGFQISGSHDIGPATRGAQDPNGR